MTQGAAQRRPRWGRRVLLGLLAVVAIAGIALAVAVRHRLDQRVRGEGVVRAPSEFTALEGSTGRAGAFAARIDFTSMATGSETISTEVAWDDEWFFQDPTAYNHELATTCSVLSAVANSESAYYQAGSDSPAYMEQALAELGFEEISTASYQYRSEVFDEVVDFIAGTDDVVAYSVATKRVISEGGAERTLFLVSIRGSYGSEWLSDLNMGGAATYGMEEITHEGFSEAAREIVDELAARVTEEAGLGGTDDICLLFTGHSRGAAAANIAAAYADEMSQGYRALAPHESIYCYTFATPAVTTFDNARDALYDNIFNVINPSDLVPRLPLRSWGYERYGHDLWLPGHGDEGFDESHAAMREVFEANTGVECPYVPEDRERVDRLVADLGREIPTVGDLATLGGGATVVKDLLADVNPMQVLYGHYPSVYIAYMQSVNWGQSPIDTTD